MFCNCTKLFSEKKLKITSHSTLIHQLSTNYCYIFLLMAKISRLCFNLKLLLSALSLLFFQTICLNVLVYACLHLLFLTTLSRTNGCCLEFTLNFVFNVLQAIGQNTYKNFLNVSERGLLCGLEGIALFLRYSKIMKQLEK